MSRALISERGYDLEAINENVLGLRKGNRKRAAAANDSNANYVRYADPDNPNNVYVRGRMPNWLIEKMSANGDDPTSPEHRAEFKDAHLVRLAA